MNAIKASTDPLPMPEPLCHSLCWCKCGDYFEHHLITGKAFDVKEHDVDCSKKTRAIESKPEPPAAPATEPGRSEPVRPAILSEPTPGILTDAEVSRMRGCAGLDFSIEEMRRLFARIETDMVVIALYRTTIVAQAAEILRLKASVEHCTVCGGNGVPISGLPCICGGSGKLFDAERNARAECLALGAENERLKQRLRGEALGT